VRRYVRPWVTRNRQTTPVSEFYIFVVDKHEHFKFGAQVYSSSSQSVNNKSSLKVAWLWHVTHFKILGGPFISRMAEARVVKFCAQVAYMKSCQRLYNVSPPKGEWLWLRKSFQFVVSSSGVAGNRLKIFTLVCQMTY